MWSILEIILAPAESGKSQRNHVNMSALMITCINYKIEDYQDSSYSVYHFRLAYNGVI